MARVNNLNTISNNQSYDAVPVQQNFERLAAGINNVSQENLTDSAVTTSKLAASSVTNDKIVTSTITRDKISNEDWVSFVPGSSNFNLGNGSMFWSYQKTGKQVDVIGKVFWGSTTGASGTVYFDLPPVAPQIPETAYQTYFPLGNATAIDTNVGVCMGNVLFNTGNKIFIAAQANQTADYREWNNLYPFSWNAGDVFMVQYSYKAS